MIEYIFHLYFMVWEIKVIIKYSLMQHFRDLCKNMLFSTIKDKLFDFHAIFTSINYCNLLSLDIKKRVLDSTISIMSMDFKTFFDLIW